MELERANANNNELSPLADPVMTILEKSDAQMRALVKPEEPLPLIRHMILGKTENKDIEECLLVCACAGSALSFIVGLNLTLGGTLVIGLSAVALGISSLVFGAKSLILLDSDRKSIGYRVQKIWQKMGLPARRLKALEMERATKSAQYKQEIDIYEKTVAQIKETVKPALEIVNQQSTKYQYSFGLKGLEGIAIMEEPTTWVGRLAKELESVDSKSENLSLDIRNSR